MSDKKENSVSSSGKGSMKKKLLIFGTAAIVALGGIYAYGVHYYDTHFHRNQMINHTKVGNLTVKEAEDVFTKDFASHTISLKEKERTEQIDPQAIGTVIDVGSQVKDLHAGEDKWTWFMDFFGEHNNKISLTMTYDEAKLKEQVNALACFDKKNIIAPEDAYVKKGKTAYEVVPEILGNTVLKKKLIAKIDEDIRSGVTEIDLEKEGLYKMPKHFEKDDDVQNALATANKYTGCTITYDFVYEDSVLDYATTKDFIKINDKFEVKIQGDQIDKYLRKLGDKYNTMGGGRYFKTANGEKKWVADGDYGWKIDAEKEKAKLIKDMKAGADVKREPVYEYTAEVRKKDTDIGDSYVEVSIASQEVWLFVDGKCIMNDSCVTGDPTKNAPTYTGAYSITYKQRNATLTGPNAGGGEYSSKVRYWMPFNGNQGLHDADWRGYFGGNEYRGNGSHGCVNLPIYAAEVLFKHVKEGFPVIIYD